MWIGIDIDRYWYFDWVDHRSGDAMNDPRPVVFLLALGVILLAVALYATNLAVIKRFNTIEKEIHEIRTR